MVKALICAVYCQKASVCKHAVIQSQICLWRSALNQMAPRLYVGQKKNHRTQLFYKDGCSRLFLKTFLNTSE